MSTGTLRREERFVGEALKRFLGPERPAEVLPGEDPPDLYLETGGERIAVEVTRLSPFTVAPDGALANRATQDAFGVGLIDRLDRDLGHLLPAGHSLSLGLEVPVEKPPAFRRALETAIREVAGRPPMKEPVERLIDGSRVWLRVIPARKSGVRIAGYVPNRHASADIGLNVRLMLADRVRAKSQICADLEGPRWLALYNDYWLAGIDTYREEARRLGIPHCFEKIVLVTAFGEAAELVFAEPASVNDATEAA